MDGDGVDLAGKIRKELLKSMTERRQTLQDAAFAAARRIYAESPRAFGKRLGVYLRLTWG